MDFSFDLSGWFFGLLSKLFDLLLGLLPAGPAESLASINSTMGPLAKFVAYILGLDFFFTAVISAYIVRFLIRRIPVIG